MTSFEVEKLEFNGPSVKRWAEAERRHTNWPVVYVLDSDSERATPAELGDIYVGETINAAARLRQHLESPEKTSLTTVRVIVDDQFNKSVCLDLESFLIGLLAGDGGFRVLNRNDGITNADYFDRERYRRTFGEVFERLRADGVFSRSIPQIRNSDLFKFSPFKALSDDQAIAVEDILSGLFEDLAAGRGSTAVIRGDPGTGKTIIAIYLLKLLADIGRATDIEDIDSDSLFSEFFLEGNRELVADLRMGIVVPQQSLRNTIKKVFKRTPGLDPGMVLNPFEVGLDAGDYDLLIVDETHRLNQRANQSSAARNRQFGEINTALFGEDDRRWTQLDWIRAKSRHQIFLLDAAQTVRPADLPQSDLAELTRQATSEHRLYPLVSQFRVRAGADYIADVRRVLSSTPPSRTLTFENYEIALFDSLPDMIAEIRARDSAVGLSRLVAGYAWEWKSKPDKSLYDIEIGDVRLRWNGTITDWIASPNSVEEVGSIHTVQGYDLNYAGVIIGPDLRFDPDEQVLYADRASYFDKKGKEGRPGTKIGDDQLLAFITNIYAVLMTRGILGTFVFVVDPALREYLRRFIPTREGTT